MYVKIHRPRESLTGSRLFLCILWKYFSLSISCSWHGAGGELPSGPDAHHHTLTEQVVQTAVFYLLISQFWTYDHHTLTKSRQYKQLYFSYLAASFEHATITLSQSRQYKQLYFGYLSASFEHMTITLSQSRQYKQLYFGYLAASFEHATATLCSHCTPDNVLLDYTQGSDYFNDCPTKADTNSNTQDNGTSWSHINCFWSNKSRHSLILCDSNSNTQDNVSCYLIKSYQLLLVQQKQILTNTQDNVTSHWVDWLSNKSRY